MWRWAEVERSGIQRSTKVVDSCVVDHLFADTRCYIGGPSILRVGRRSLVATHDIFGSGSSGSHIDVIGSDDDGVMWTRLAAFDDQQWSTLFLKDGELHPIGTGRTWGDVVVRRSGDLGRRWTRPIDDRNGLMLQGAKHHCAPTPVIHHGGRIWRAMEDAGPEGRDLSALVMSVPEGSDLLRSASWRCTNQIHQDRSLLDGGLKEWLESNLAVDPDGRVVNVQRVSGWTVPEKAAILPVDGEGRVQVLDPRSGFVDMPGGGKKFTIRRDLGSGRYLALTNHVADPAAAGVGIRARNYLYLISSPDLRVWTVGERLLRHPGYVRCAFQYADWVFDGGDILFTVHTAAGDEHGEAHNYHDADYLTFHRLSSYAGCL